MKQRSFALVGESFALKRSDAPRRVAWIDASRGLIIGIIAIYHAAQSLNFIGLRYQPAANTISLWITIGMSLFFLLSGMNSRKYLHGTWDLAWRRRIGPLIWLLVIWVPIYWIVDYIILGGVPFTYSDALWALLAAYISPSWALWFLWTLIIYCILSKLITKLPHQIALVFFGIISFLFLCTSDHHLYRLGLGWIVGSYNWRSALSYYFFFYIGLRYTSEILKAATLPLLSTFLVSLMLRMTLIKLDGIGHTVLIDGPFRLGALLAGLILAISYGRILARLDIVRNVGAATLPIYLIHALLISAFVQAPILLPFIVAHDNAILPIGIGLTSVVVSLVAALLLNSVGLSWLFKPPAILIAYHDRLLRRDSKAS